MLTLTDVERYVRKHYVRKRDQPTGVWTPVLTGSTGDPSMTYTTQTGKWTMIANMVFYRAIIVPNTITVAGTGDIRISLPFTVPDSQNLAQIPGSALVSGVDLQVNTRSLSFRPVQNTAYGILRESQDNATIITTPWPGLADGDTISVAGFYFTG